jgi:VWFA-related protein
MSLAAFTLSAVVGITSGAEARPEAADAQTPAESGQQPRPTFKAAVDLVSVSAVVRDRKGRVVRNLSQHDFQVLDQGEARRIVGFSADELGPTSLAILFDVSGSMMVASKIQAARHAADHIVSWMHPNRDEAAVFAFDTELRELQPFTTDYLKLHEALDGLKPYGATSLYDAIAETARRLETRSNKRRAIVVLTDGADNWSRLTAEDVSGIASVIDVPVYLIAVVPPIDDPRAQMVISGVNSTAAALEGRLKDLAVWTGGDLFIVSAPAHASVAARQLLTELRHQYLIAFESTGQEGWHRLEVRAKDPDLRVRARSGYLADDVPGNEPLGK